VVHTSRLRLGLAALAVAGAALLLSPLAAYAASSDTGEIYYWTGTSSGQIQCASARDAVSTGGTAFSFATTQSWKDYYCANHLTMPAGFLTVSATLQVQYGTTWLSVATSNGANAAGGYLAFGSNSAPTSSGQVWRSLSGNTAGLAGAWRSYILTSGAVTA